MYYQSDYLTNEETSLFKSSLDPSITVLCTTVAQIYTYEPKRMKNWALLSTGVLYLAKSDTNVISMGLFHLLSKMKEWEEEVYLEMILTQSGEKMLTFEGKKCIVLLNFGDERECKHFMDTFNRYKQRELISHDEDDYADIYPEVDGEYHEYEALGTDENPKIDKKRFNFNWIWNWKGKEEKKKEGEEKRNQRKSNDKIKRKTIHISSPKTETLVHVSHAEVTSAGLVIEGMDKTEFNKLLKETVKNKENAENGKYIEVNDHNISDAQKMTRWTSNPEIQVTKRYELDFSTTTNHKTESTITEEHDVQPEKPNINSLPKKPIAISPKPNMSLKPNVPSKANLKPVLSQKPVISGKKPEIISKKAELNAKLNGFKPLSVIKEGTSVVNMKKQPLALPEKSIPGTSSSIMKNEISAQKPTNLLDEIRQGTKLKHVGEINKKPTKYVENGNSGFPDMRTTLQKRFTAFGGAGDDSESDPEDDTYFDNDAFKP